MRERERERGRGRETDATECFLATFRRHDVGSLARATSGSRRATGAATAMLATLQLTERNSYNNNTIKVFLKTYINENK